MSALPVRSSYRLVSLTTSTFTLGLAAMVSACGATTAPATNQGGTRVATLDAEPGAGSLVNSRAAERSPTFVVFSGKEKETRSMRKILSAFGTVKVEQTMKTTTVYRVSLSDAERSKVGTYTGVGAVRMVGSIALVNEDSDVAVCAAAVAATGAKVTFVGTALGLLNVDATPTEFNAIKALPCVDIVELETKVGITGIAGATN